MWIINDFLVLWMATEFYFMVMRGYCVLSMVPWLLVLTFTVMDVCVMDGYSMVDGGY